MRTIALTLLLLAFACSGEEGGDAATPQGGSAMGGNGSGASAGQAAGGNGTGAGGAAAMGGGPAGGAPPSASSVPCNGSECAEGEICCFDNTINAQVRCDAPGQCDTGDIELSCNHPDDCPGGTCCSVYDGMVQTMACTANCNASDEYVMCSGPDQDACPQATTCSNAQAGTGYHYCAP
jgi:hypothetical protein